MKSQDPDERQLCIVAGAGAEAVLLLGCSSASLIERCLLAGYITLLLATLMQQASNEIETAD